MAGRESGLVLTCEHGGRRVPAAYRSLFAGRRALLDSHRGWDPGALPVARQLARLSGWPLVAATTTRLLVDLNRSPHNPAVFSDVTAPLTPRQRDTLLAHHHRPHWDRVRAALATCRGPVLHVAVHSFTPILGGQRRSMGIGLLYDPQREAERDFAIAWQRRLRDALPDVGIRRNAPYRGDADGLATALRREFGDDQYLGFELELNQGLLASARHRREMADVLHETLTALRGPSRTTRRRR